MKNLKDYFGTLLTTHDVLSSSTIPSNNPQELINSFERHILKSFNGKIFSVGLKYVSVKRRK